jgi:hypothetical protein
VTWAWADLRKATVVAGAGRQHDVARLDAVQGDRGEVGAEIEMRLGWAAARAWVAAWAAERSSALARGRKTSPASVSRLPWGVRSGSRAPNCCSRRRICRLNDGCAADRASRPHLDRLVPQAARRQTMI